MIRVLLVDDQAILCQALQTWLEQESDIEVVGRAYNGYDAITQAKGSHPDVVLIDIEMPDMDGIEATRILCQAFSNMKVIVLSSHNDDAYLARAVRAGAKGYLLKTTSAEDLANTIRSVHRGYGQFGPGLFEKLVARVTPLKTEAIAPETADESVLSETDLTLLLQRFDVDALPEAVTHILDQRGASNVVNRLNAHLKTDSTNLSALYLAGALSHRGQHRTLAAFQYLRFGFKEGIRQQLSPEGLLLFYREGVLLRPDEAFAWLMQPDSPWSTHSGSAFLLQEATHRFGATSKLCQRLQIWYQIKSLHQFGEDCLALETKVTALQQGFARLNQALTL
ncbi:MAG: response regulator [Elainellaceae cyanobacterium]